MAWVLPRSKSQRCRLLELPVELRARIFAFALTSEKPLVTFHLDEYQREVYQEANEPALLAVSKQVRDESQTLYYQSNAFVFYSEGKKANDAAQWLRHASPYLDRLGSVVFWLRCLTRVPCPAGPQGAIAIRMRYTARAGCWKVADDWSWISIVKRSEDADADARFLVAALKRLMLSQPRSLSCSFVADLMTTLRKQYIDYKIH